MKINHGPIRYYVIIILVNYYLYDLIFVALSPDQESVATSYACIGGGHTLRPESYK